MKSSIFTILAFLSISLVSCSKDNETKPAKLGDDLTGMAKEVFDIVWGKQAPANSNHLFIGETSEFVNTETGAIESFEVATVADYTSQNDGEGSGISIKGGNYEIRVVEFPTQENYLVARCFMNSKEVMSRGYTY